MGTVCSFLSPFKFCCLISNNDQEIDIKPENKLTNELLKDQYQQQIIQLDISNVSIKDENISNEHTNDISNDHISDITSKRQPTIEELWRNVMLQLTEVIEQKNIIQGQLTQPISEVTHMHTKFCRRSKSKNCKCIKCANNTELNVDEPFENDHLSVFNKMVAKTDKDKKVIKKIFKN